MKPLIGIAPLFDDERNSIWMLPDYMNAIRHAGGVPVILPLEGTSEDICAAASVCSGFVLTGGQDVDPKIYGETPLPQCGTPNETRDQTDYLILCYAMEHNLPLLGICRGIQLINAGLGGTLWQDLPSQTGTKIMHSQPPPRDIPVHDVRIIPGTPLHELLKTEKPLVLDADGINALEAAGGAAAYLLLGVGRQPSVLLRQRMGHGAPALHRRRRPHALRHAQKHQPAAAALRGGGAQHRRAGIAHAASQQIDLSERPLVSRRIAAGHQAPHIFPVDGPHGAPPPAFLYSIAHVSIVKAAFFVSRREKSACIFCFVVI